MIKDRKKCLKKGCYPSRFFVGVALAFALAVWVGSAYSAEIDYPLNRTDTFSGHVGTVHSAIGAYQKVPTVTLENVYVPADATVLKAYLYWGGVNTPYSHPGDDLVTFTRNGQSATNFSADFGRHIDLSDHWDANHMACIADVTSLIAVGTYDYTVSDYLMQAKNFGVGLQIVYEENSMPASDITIYQGADFAFAGDNWNSTAVFHGTVPLVHELIATDYERQLKATFFVGDAANTWPGTNRQRPDSLWYKTGNALVPDRNALSLVDDLFATELVNPLHSTSGAQWDTVVQVINLPAGHTWVAFEFESGDGSGSNMSSSFTWTATTLEVVPEPATLLLLLIGGGLLLIRRKHKISFS